MQAAKKLSPHSAHSKHLAIVVAVTVYASLLGWDRVRTNFAADDMMNMGQYFLLGPAKALAAQLLFWKGYYRPMGAAFYLPLYHWFGLNPAPFQAAILALLAINAIVLYWLAITLGAGEVAAGVAALVAAYPAGLTNLVYKTDMIYDVLCFLFFTGAALAYAAVRERGRRLDRKQTALFLFLYLCALNSKEMALTMPLVLAAYEFFYQRRRARRWTLPAITAAMAALSFYGKIFGVQALVANSSYRPEFSLYRFLKFQKGALHDLLAQLATPGWRGVLFLWALVGFLAWRRNHPLLRFTWAWMLVTPLPIAFLPDRFQGCLYLPLAGWAIFAAAIAVALAKALANVLVNEPIFRRLGRSGVFALLIACAVLLWTNRMRYLKTEVVRPAAASQGALTARVIGQLRALNPRVPPGSQVVFRNDPFPGWDMTFIGALWFGDRSIHVYNQRQERLSPGEMQRMDHIFDFENGRLVQVK
ncbi:MAG TPA: hypothetical protein VKV17_13315 [Bryobacteraceae bacterium]|nr:hypothetical protein [Bryobacteraceae bacterium]